MKTHFRIILHTIIFGTLLVGVLNYSTILNVVSKQAFAQQTTIDDIGLSVSPTLVEMKIQPGKRITQAFTIQNTGDHDLEITPSFIKFEPNAETGEPTFLLDSPLPPYARLFNQDKAFDKPFELKKGARDQVILQIDLPKNTKEQDLYHSLLIKARTSPNSGVATTAAPANQNSVSSANGYVAINVLITVTSSGEDRGELHVHKLQVPRTIDSFFPFQAKLFVTNTGSTFTKAQGLLSIQPFLHNKKEWELMQDNVLVNHPRQIFGQGVKKQNTDGKIEVQPEQFSYDTFFLIGPIKTAVELHSPNGTTERMMVTTWAFPYALVLFLLSVFTVMHVLRRKIVSAQFTKQAKKQETEHETTV